jgi:hypothetical protein
MSMRRYRATTRVLVPALFAGSLVSAALFTASAAPAASGTTGAKGSVLHSIRFMGTVNVTKLGRNSHQASFKSDRTHRGGLYVRPEFNPKGEEARSATPSAGPEVPGLPVQVSGVQPIDGVNAADSRLARNGNQFTNAPPDGGICAGNSGIKVETVNSAFGFFDATEQIVFPPIAQSSFFGLPPSIDRSTSPPTFPGPSLGDAKCVYDHGSGRMVLLTWGTGQDPQDGSFTGTNDFFIAVAKTQNVLGDYNIYDLSLDPPGSPGCDPACLSDHPTLSTDANTVVTTYNKYNAGSEEFLGARIIALSKAAMIAGDIPNAVEFEGGELGGGLLYTLQGAQAPTDGSYATANNGTMWFLSALQFVPGQADDRVALEALTNTAAIDSDPGDLEYSKAIVPGTNRYDTPPVIPQKRGPHPLGKAVGEGLNYLDAGGDEMQPVWYAGGQIWGILDSRVGVRNTLRGGLLWMTVNPSGSPGNISGVVTHQQFLSVTTNWLAYGAIAVNGAGTKAIVAASWAGPTVYPSAVYGWLDTNTWLVTSIKAYAVGVRPIDDFDCYKAFNPGFKRGCRFGDYNGATLNKAANSFKLEAEWVSSRPRVFFANWATALASATF